MEKKEKQVIIIGDFNSETAEDLIKKGKERKGCKIIKQLFKYLEDKGFTDLRQVFTNRSSSSIQQGREIETRIDYIQVSRECFPDCLEYENIDAQNITFSDHNIISATLLSGVDLSISRNATHRRTRTKRIVFDTKNTSEEKWKEYSKTLDQIISNDWLENIKHCKVDDKKIQSIDVKWDIINKAIDKAAKKTLPKEKVRKKLVQELPDQVLQAARKEVKELSKLCRKCKHNLAKSIEAIDKIAIEIKIKEVEKYSEEEIQINLETWSEDLYSWLTAQCKIIYCFWNNKRKIIEEAEIKKKIQERGEMIVTDPKRMLNSILNRNRNSIRLDKIVEESEGVWQLVNEEKEVKQAVRNYFEGQFAK